MANYEYKLGRSAGVLGLRPVGTGALGASDANVVSQKFEGVAVDDNDVYRTTFVNGKSILTDQIASTTTTYWVATRINHPTEGNILYADATNTIAINLDHVLYAADADTVSFDSSGDGAIDGSASGIRYHLADGTKVTVIPVQMAV